ncbi:MAG: S41 family peptidase [Anaerolineae bacterium]|nr:S41 family peptidase [Anaerolineae bacterium]
MPNSRRGFQLVGCLALGLCLAVVYAAGFGAYQLWERQQNLQQSHNNPQEQFGVFWEAWRVMEQDFFGELPSAQDRTYGAIRELLVLLGDPYTIFVEPQPRELERDHMRGSFGGIGVDIWYDAEGRVVLSPYPDSPAAEAGVLEGDILLALDGEPITTEKTIDDVRAYLHGEQGTQVMLTLMRLDDGSPTPSFDLAITRGEIRVPSVTWRALDQASSVGYIHIQGFTDRTDEEVIDAINGLKEKGVTSLVLDLRNNYGGLISPAVDVASQFLRDGVVMIEEKRNADEKTYAVRSGGSALDIPMVVLVDGNTASAAEIVAGALQDHERAPLIGERTFGKGSVQLIYDLSDGSSLHVTTAIWLTPNRNRIEGRGLTPDVIATQGEGPQDAQLDYAVEYLLQ